NALSNIGDETDLTSDPRTLVTPYTSLLTAFEDAGLASTEILSDTLDTTVLSTETTTMLTSFLDAYLEQQATHLGPVVSSQASQYGVVIGDPDAFTDAFPNVHTVVFEGFFAPSELQWQLIEAIPDEVRIEAVLPYPEWDETAIEGESFVTPPNALTSNSV